jgi:hypothetical protein
VVRDPAEAWTHISVGTLIPRKMCLVLAGLLRN